MPLLNGQPALTTRNVPAAEIRHFAERLVESYGRGASARCAGNSRKFLAEGDVEGYALWCRIEETVDALLRSRAGA